MNGYTVVSVQYNPIIGDIQGNKRKIISWIQKLERAHPETQLLLVFPELSLTGYPPKDLLFIESFLHDCEESLQEIANSVDQASVIVGAPRKSPLCRARVRNSLFLIESGKCSPILDKQLLPSYDIFDEPRYFEPGESDQYLKGQGIIHFHGTTIALTLCEDIWTEDHETARYYIDKDILPLGCLEKAALLLPSKRIDLLINVSASPWYRGKFERRIDVAKKVSHRFSCPVLLVNQVGAQDDLLFDGRSFFVDSSQGKEGVHVYNASAFQESLLSFVVEERRVKKVFFDPDRRDCEPSSDEELFYALTMGIKDYFSKQGFQDAIVGLSGGIDSAVVLSLLTSALGKEHVKAVMLPTRYTSKESLEDASAVASACGVPLKEISIDPYIDLLAQATEIPLSQEMRSSSDQLAWENLQARLRGLLLMAVSNKEGRLLIGTSNKSELAAGYSTLYGDAIGAFSPLGDLLKREVYSLAKWIQKNILLLPERVFLKEPTAELSYNQKDSDTLPPYPVLDLIVEELVCGRSSNQSKEIICQIEKRLHASEYKRRQAPFCFKISQKAFGSGRRIPLVHLYKERQ